MTGLTDGALRAQNWEWGIVMKGRKPKPTNLKLLAGNPGRHPLNKNEPKPPPVAPRCPGWLNKTAKKEWKRIAPSLEQLGLLTEIDMANLAAYCRTYAEMIKAEQFLEKHGLTYQIPKRDEEGNVISLYVQQWPQISIVRRCQEEIRSYSALFGLSPSDRSRMSLPGRGENIDPFEEFLARGKKTSGN